MKKLVLIIIGITLISFLPQVLAQQISIGELAKQTVKISIDENGGVRVIHQVEKSGSVKQVPFVKGTYSNLKVIDVKGNEPQYATVGGENQSITLFPTSDDVIIEYDLDGALQQSGEMWRWDFLYLGQPIFIFPESVDVVFANDRPVKIDNLRQMRCHGCQAIIEYIIDEPIQRNVVKWEDREFIVGVRTLAEITSFSFEQPTRTISFDVSEGNQFVTLSIPLELLWNPYDVYLNEKNILKHEFFSNETHVLLNIRPQTSGTVLIIGTSAVPEFPILVPLFFGITIVILLQLKNRVNLR